MTYREQLKAARRQILATALEEAGGCRAEAARQLGIGRTSFFHLMKLHAVEGPPPPSRGATSGYRRAVAEGRVGWPRKRV